MRVIWRAPSAFAASSVRRMPGVLSAYGMLVADMSAEYATSVLSLAADLIAEPSALSAAVAQLEARTRDTLALDASAAAHTAAALDMRYRGQSYELTVPLALPLSAANLASAVDAFHRAHAQRYGYAMPAEAVEAVTLRIRSSIRRFTSQPAAPAARRCRRCGCPSR